MLLIVEYRDAYGRRREAGAKSVRWWIPSETNPRGGSGARFSRMAITRIANF
jgi:hypothetical protein